MRLSYSMGPGTRAAIWAGMYVICWLLMGASCLVDLPADCRRASGPVEVLKELTILFVFALSQAFICGIVDKDRFRKLFSKAYFPVVVVGSGLVISAFTHVDELAGMRNPASEFSTFQWAISIFLVVIIGFALFYHFALAWEHLLGAVLTSNGMRGALEAEDLSGNRLVDYCFTCLLVMAHVGVFGAFAFSREDGWEYHYILLAWVLSLIARFDNALSVVWLGVTTAMFLQGVGAYSLRFLAIESLSQG